MVDTEEDALTRPMPPRRALVGGKLEDLEWVTVWIAEVEGLDAPRVRVPVRQTLWTRRDLPHIVPTEPEVALLDVVGDDRDMLEPGIVAPRVGRGRPTTRRAELGQLDVLGAEPHGDHTRSQTGEAGESLVGRAGHLGVRCLLEAEHVSIERHRALHVRHGEPDRADLPDPSRLGIR